MADLPLPDTVDFGNALLAVLQRQRNNANDLYAKAEANVAVLEADNARLATENAKLRKEATMKATMKATMIDVAKAEGPADDSI